MSSIAATPREGDSGYSYEGSSTGSHSPLELGPCAAGVIIMVGESAGEAGQ